MPSNYKRFDLFWIVISVICLGTAGLYSLAVSMMRIPAIYNIFHLPEFFKISLVIHVTLSINFWFMITGLYHFQNYLGRNFITKISKYLVGISLSLIIISGFIPYSSPIIINYIPLIDNYFFIIGIAIFFSTFLGLTLSALKKILIDNKKEIFSDLFLNLLFSTIFSIIIAYLCLFASYLVNKQYILPGAKFNLEEFTWGIGHILQFTFVEIGFLCLVKVLSKYNNFLKIEKLPRWFNILFFLKIILLSVTPFFYLSTNYYELFTIHMRHGIGLFLIPTSFLIIKNIQLHGWRNWSHYSIIGLILMIAMNLYGGILGFSIKEINVVVPAHYHGSLLAIAITIMSFTYGLLSSISKKINLDLITANARKALFAQLLAYGIGDAMHITGLVIMGGYGALRKTPGDIPLDIIFGKIVFIIGSILSVIAGIFFIGFVIYSVIKISKHRSYI